MPNAMRIMDPTGHTTLSWSADNDNEVEIARETFIQMRAKGYRAFHVTEGGQRSTPMLDFDPAAEDLILIPQLVGG